MPLLQLVWQDGPQISHTSAHHMVKVSLHVIYPILPLRAMLDRNPVKSSSTPDHLCSQDSRSRLEISPDRSLPRLNLGRSSNIPSSTRDLLPLRDSSRRSVCRRELG
jgi:hypothetical protein